jgi:hypothetical protein
MMMAMTLLLLLASAASRGATAAPPRRLLFMDCDPPSQRGWASTCAQEDVAVTAEPGLNSTCSAYYEENPDWIVCAGERLVSVHKRWGMPGLLSIGSLWSKPCNSPKTCGCPAAPGTTTQPPCNPYGPALPPDWDQRLGTALRTLRPAFQNGSIEGVALGDELAGEIHCTLYTALGTLLHPVH